MTDPIKDKVIRILAEQAVLEPGDVRMEQSLADLGIDSLGLVECIYALEEEFDISIPFNANEPGQSEFDVSTVSAVVEAVKDLVARQQA